MNPPMGLALDIKYPDVKRMAILKISFICCLSVNAVFITQRIRIITMYPSANLAGSLSGCMVNLYDKPYIKALLTDTYESTGVA